MKILFVVSHVFYSEPLGAMQLSALCKEKGHSTRLAVLSNDDIEDILTEFQPDVVGYSTMTSNENMFLEADASVLGYMAETGKDVFRVMGGPHPTYFPDILVKMKLDAIVCGDGDFAMLEILERLSTGQSLKGIPNCIAQEGQDYGEVELVEKEVIQNMDVLPPLDRDLIYNAVPDLQKAGIRSFLTQRGCPYKCTYCFNHAFNKMFKGDGRKLLRRRSVDNVISEIKHVVDNYPTVRFIRFADDVFTIRRDDWLEEFAEKYPKEIGLPFYALMRANSLTEDVAVLLQKAGCKSLGMSIEAGTNELRNVVLKRNMDDQMMIDMFKIARKYGINAYANTMMGLPGTTLEDDFQAIRFVRQVQPAAPTFGIFCPYPNTELTAYAKKVGVLPDEYDYTNTYRNETVLTNYTPQEKQMQLRLSYLAPAFVFLPEFMQPMLKPLIRLPFTGLYSLVSSVVTASILSFRIFPGAQPRDPVYFARSAVRAVGYFFGNSRSKKKYRYRQFPGFESTEMSVDKVQEREAA